jgi:exodeoxyribonuclease-3
MTNTLRLLSYNIRQGGVGREDALAAAIREAPSRCRDSAGGHAAGCRRAPGGGNGPSPLGCRRGDSLAFLTREPVVSAAWHRPRLSRHAFLELLPAGGHGVCSASI